MNMTGMSPNWPTGFRIGLFGHAAPTTPVVQQGLVTPSFCAENVLTWPAIPVGQVVKLFLNRLMAWCVIG